MLPRRGLALIVQRQKDCRISSSSKVFRVTHKNNLNLLKTKEMQKKKKKIDMANFVQGDERIEK